MFRPQLPVSSSLVARLNNIQPDNCSCLKDCRNYSRPSGHVTFTYLLKSDWCCQHSGSAHESVSFVPGPHTYVYAYAYTYFLPRASNSNCARRARARRKLRIDMARETSAHAYVQQTRNANLTQYLLRACARVRCVRCAAAFLDSALVAECFRGVATPQTPPLDPPHCPSPIR